MQLVAAGRLDLDASIHEYADLTSTTISDAYPPLGAPDGGACCTAGDLHAFFAALRERQLLPDDLTDVFLTPQVARADGLPATVSARVQRLGLSQGR